MVKGILKMGPSSPRSWIGKPFTQGWPFSTFFQIVGKSVPFVLSALQTRRRSVTTSVIMGCEFTCVDGNEFDRDQFGKKAGRRGWRRGT